MASVHAGYSLDATLRELRAIGECPERGTANAYMVAMVRANTVDGSLLDSLLPQMVRMETWAAAQCAWEASFLPDDVGALLRLCSAHARQTIEPLRRLAERAIGKRLESLKPVERAMLAARFVAFHRFATREASYRATLQGLREGFDLFLLAFEAASEGGPPELAELCESWLRTRAELIEGASAVFSKADESHDEGFDYSRA